MTSPAIGIEEVGIGDQVRLAVLAQLQRMELTRSKSVAVVATGEKRSAATNAMIARVQAAQGRDAGFLTQEAKEEARFIARGATAEDASVRGGVLPKLGNLLLRTVLDNIARGMSKGPRPMRQLSAKYAAWKRKRFGAQPILVASGELRDNLAIRIEE